VKPFFALRLCALLLLPSIVFASGSLKGVVTDAATKEALVGAHVLLVGTSIGGATDLVGGYFIRAIPAGRYAAKCSYVGYDPKDVQVVITDEGTVTLDFSLHAVAVEGQEVVITGQASGQVAAINQQLTSSKIVNVISEQKIKELPDANAAEAIGRLPGVSVTRSGGEANKIILRGLSETMTTITVDGVQLSATDADSRGVDLSTIAQGSLSGITLTKAITADMDGQAIAGNVNFVTKAASSERLVQLTAQGMYNGMDKAYGQYNLYGNYGERFFDDILGVQVFGNIERRIRSSENISLAYNQYVSRAGAFDWNIASLGVQYVPEERRRRGGKIILDVNTPDAGVVKLALDANRTERRLSYMTRYYPTPGGEVNYNFGGQDFNTDILAVALQGENHIAGFDADWGLSFTQSQTDMPYNYALNFLEPALLQNGVVISGMKAVPIEQRKGPYELFIPYAMNNFSYASIQWGDISTNNSLDLQRTARLDVRRAYTLFDYAGEVKFGGKMTAHYHRRYSSAYFSPYYNGVQYKSHMINDDGVVVPKDLAAYGFGTLAQNAGLIFVTNFISGDKRDVFGRYALNPLFIADKMRSFYEMTRHGYDPNNNTHEYSDNTQNAGTDYGAMEGVTSGYLMNTLNFGRFATLIAGVRVEADNNDYTALYSPTILSNYSTFRDTAGAHTESLVLPNLHLILRPTDFMNVRLAAYRGILRPDFNLRLPTYVTVGIASYVDSWQLKLGNPGLKNASAWNYEANVQFYGDKIGLLSMSGYYKEISDQVEYLNGMPIFPGSKIADSMGVMFRGGKVPFNYKYLLFYPYNSPEPTKVWGLELEHQLNFRYLPGLLSGITLSYNLSLVRNETWTPYAKIVMDTTYNEDGFPMENPRVVLAESKTRIASAPEFFANAVIGYDIGGFSARLSYFHQGEFYNSFSSNQRSNILQRQFERWDLSFKQDIDQMFSVGLNINNLTNTTEGTILENVPDGYRLEVNSYRYGTTADLWLRISL
jgi:TonB-dependent receptor